MLFVIYTVMYYESLLSLFDFVIIQIHVFFKKISWNTVCYDFGVRTPNPTQRRTYSKTFITSVFSVVLNGAQIPSTEYESEYEYKKSFITLGPGNDHRTEKDYTEPEQPLRKQMYLWESLNSRGLKIHQSRMKCVPPHSGNER